MSAAPPSAEARVVMRDAGRGEWLHFQRRAGVIQAHTLAEVLPGLRQVQAGVQAGLHAAGFIAYEAAPAFDAALTTHPPLPGLPLLWFGLFADAQRSPALPPAPALPAAMTEDWQADTPRPRYLAAIAAIKRAIARGDTYQVNYTLRLTRPFAGEAWALFLAMQQAQQGAYGAFIETSAFAICSASPELFFTLDGEQLCSRPMKGTAPRGRHLAADEANRRWLQHSLKNRAENVMIVDMIRNDMGRVAEIGSVQAPRLFEVERYPTVLQMTSSVQARTRAGLIEVLGALFPCASITGAPKVRTMQIIRELEGRPRGVYTGAVGFAAPAGEDAPPRTQFNVAIRTLVVDKAAAQATYGVGGGIVWDSKGEAEYAECQVKARILTAPPPVFSLLESLYWHPGGGYWLLQRHLQRLAAAAIYFVRPLDVEAARALLLAQADQLRAQRPAAHKVRLLAGPEGDLTCEATPILPAQPRRALRLGLAAAPVDATDPFLYFKTTHRRVYEQAGRCQQENAVAPGRAPGPAGIAPPAWPGCDDVLLWNERGELTESSRANLVIAWGGALLTPPLDCGLLAGVYRGELLDRGLLREQVIRREMLASADAIFLINSVRGWMRAIVERDRLKTAGRAGGDEPV